MSDEKLVLGIPLPSPDELAARIDHAVLGPGSGRAELENAIRELEELKLRCLILSPPLLREARGLTKRCLGAVVGFPFGYQTLEAKIKELEDVIGYGADEVDAVLNTQLFIIGRREVFVNEARALAEICRENGVKCKLIIETTILDRDAAVEAAASVLEKAEPDFLKTSTGYGPRPTQPEDVLAFRLARARTGRRSVGIKAAGGIRTGLQAALLIALGADIIGTSRPAELLRDYRRTLATLKPA